MSDMSIEDQGAAAVAFLDGLVDAFDLEGSASSTVLEDDIVEITVDGDDLGLLIGPKGRTLWAIQELTKTVVQREAGGGLRGRIRLDVGGYRERRRAALSEFTRRAAGNVVDKGCGPGVGADGRGRIARWCTTR